MHTAVPEGDTKRAQSPEFVKVSHASAISLGFMSGRMYRGAVNRCVNLLVHYPEGCSANCAYCGLAKKRPGRYEEKSFIHVAWPLHPVDRVIEGVNHAPSYVKRTCISMITNGKCREDTLEIARLLASGTSHPVSVLVSPAILDEPYLIALKDAGVDKMGVALDLATPELFEKYRGDGVSGPHKWERYWETMEAGLRVFGPGNVGAHLMVGLGETEREMVLLMQGLWRMGVVNHLFSFFAEKGSVLARRPQPPWPTYLRVQLARYLIEEGVVVVDDIAFDSQGHIVDFGLSSRRLTEIINSGIPFMTTGCLGSDGQVACNRPFGNCLPDERQWNYPYRPNEQELSLIRRNLFDIQ